jgi:hypothetical protein
MSARVESVPVVAARRLRVSIDGKLVVIHDEPITAGWRQFTLQRVAKDDGEDLIVPRNARQVGLRSAADAEEITENDDQAARSRDTPERCHRQRERRFAICNVRVFTLLPVGMLGEFVEKSQCRLPAEPGLKFPVHRVTEDEATETVATMMCRP